MITYGSTTLTSYNTITNIEVYYYKSTSATSLSGGSWSTTKPTWENGKYIWQKIRTTYEGKLENGLYYSESDPVNITGQQGATGTAAYSYKLNASDTTITVSKTGVYSTNKITFTATSKQGTGSVNAYAGIFKIETTINGTTWTTSYTSSGNESSKEFTIPTGIIAIRCSLYQANGTTTLLDIMTIPILSDDRPIATKTYTGLIGSANDAANASFYFAKIHPDNYTTNYKVKMKVRVTAPEAYAETIDIQFGGYKNTFSSFDAYTTRTESIGVYYINLYRATQAGISTNHKGHALGIGLRSSTNPTNTSYKRTIIVDILELDGCTIEMLDTAVKYANIDGTGSTNYYGLTEMAVDTAGQNATNNSNTHYTQYSNNVKAGTNGIKGYTLIMKDSENTWSCFYSGAYKVANTGKPAYTGGFILGKILYSAGAGAQTSDSSLDTYYNYKSGVNTSTIYDAYPVDLRYSTNCASTLTSQRPVYIVGTIENDGLFHLDVSQWYTQTEPTYADGKVYVYVGMAYSTYQVWLSTENPAYMFYNGEFILYDKAQTLQNINTLKNSLETQIDSKVETWCQKTNPANSWTAEERPNHTGDLWYYIGESGTTYKNNTTYQYNGETNVWSTYSANPDLFDKIDGKTAIYYGTTSSVASAEEGDYLVDSENDCTYRWNNGAWVLATDYKQVAIDAVEIGGRNLLYSTPKTYSATAYGAYDFELTEPLEAAQTYTIQLWNIDVSHSAKTAEQLGVNVYYCGGSVTFGGWIGTEYFINGHADHLSLTFTPTEANINHSEVTGAVKKFIRIYNSVPSVSGTLNMSIEKWQLQKGNKATDWSFAPEDVDINNINIGGRNLLYNTATMPAVSNGDKGWRASGGTVTHIDLINPPIYNVTGAIRVTNNDSTAKQIGMAQDKIKNKFIAGEKYTQSCWIRASETLRVYLSPIWASSGQATGGSSSVMDYFSIGTEWTYIKWEGAVLKGEQATSYSAGYVYAYQAPANSWFEVCGMKLEKGNKATDWTPAPEDTQADIDTALAQSIWYATCSDAGATKSATITPVTTNFVLNAGTTVNVKFTNTNTGAIGSLTLNINNTGAKNIKYIYNGSITNIPSAEYLKANQTYQFYYDGTYWVVQMMYNSNSVDRTQYGIALAASEAIASVKIAVCGTNGKLHILNTSAFDITCPPLYVGTAYTADDVTKSTTRVSNYRYWGTAFNYTNTHSIAGAVAGKPIYIVGTLNGNIFTPNSTVLTCTEPTTENGLYYMRLGTMSTTTNGVLEMDHPIYIFYNGSFITIEGAEAEKAQNLATAVYGTCSTGATTVDKVVTCSNFTLFDGARIQITFANANTAVASEATTASPTLNVNGTGRKPIKIGIEEANTANPLYWAAGATIEFVYDGSAWILQNAPYTLYGTCNTEENVREKQVVCDGAVVCKGTTIYVDMLYSNTADSNSENGNVTLNVANTIAKTIYANNSTLTIRSRYNWNAGENPSFTFDGQYWQMDKDTVPAYITDKDEDGIFVHPINDTASGWSIGKVFELLNNGYSYIKMWLEDVTDNLSAKIRIGREDQHHILLDKEIIKFKKGNTPEELASFSSSGISFDDGVPFKIGNDSTYVQFVDNNSDGVADALEIVADKISFKNGGNNTVQDIQERFNDLQTDISNITNNIEINPTADTPYVAITTQKDEYNAGLKLEPTQLSFQLNGQTTATIANDEMNIPTASVTNLFMQSANQSYEKIWVMRSNGHLSLKVGKQN